MTGKEKVIYHAKVGGTVRWVVEMRGVVYWYIALVSQR